MEYAVGNIAVAISWSEYFTTLLSGLGLHIPEFLTIDFLSASRGYREAILQIAQGTTVENLSWQLREAYLAWTNSPQLFGFHLIFDLPAFGIVIFISSLVYIGIYESKVAGNIMVLLKLVILMAFIGVGVFYVNPGNWSPFAPNGLPGVLKGVAGVFFAYIGFDAISTTAEESKNPQKDLPKAMILSLAITSVLYIIISLVLTGMVSYKELNVADPLAFVFQKVHLLHFSGLIAFSAIIAMASVLLVFQIGQPRIWMSMSRDGLLPKIFSSIHPKYKTPWFSTIVTGVFVAIPALFLNLTEVTDLTSIGTLFAFVLVSGGVLLIKKDQDALKSKKGFRVPYYDSRKWLPLIAVLLLSVLGIWYPEGLNNLVNEREWHNEWPVLVFLLVTVVIFILSVVKKLSLIPVLGLLTNLYLMSQLGVTNWLRFLIWLIIGLVLYISYGYGHSKLRLDSKSGSKS
jgi:amino acid transporter